MTLPNMIGTARFTDGLTLGSLYVGCRVMAALEPADWVSSSALLGAAGWAISGVVVLHGMRLANQKLWLRSIYAIACLMAMIATSTLGARQHRDARLASQPTLSVTADIRRIVGSKPDADQIQVLQDAVSKVQAQQREIDLLRGRTLLKAARDSFPAELRQLGHHYISILYVPADAEAELFARRLAEVFHDGGWAEARPIRPYALDQTGGAMPLGLKIYCRCSSESAIPPVVDLIVQVMAASQIAVSRHIGQDPQLPDDQSISILVGQKPQDPSGADFFN